MELLLLSSSRTPAGYLTDYLADIKTFTAGVRCAVFVPFAAVALPWDEYARRVSEAIGMRLESVDELPKAELIVVGGGNTFQLLRECRMRGVLPAIQEKVKSGARYLGWSAGANLACPTIKTTNDMPIVDPGGLEALGLVRFQINPHYLSVALPEGARLRVSGASLELRGPHSATWFEGTKPPVRIAPGIIPYKRQFYSLGRRRNALAPRVIQCCINAYDSTTTQRCTKGRPRRRAGATRRWRRKGRVRDAHAAP